MTDNEYTATTLTILPV